MESYSNEDRDDGIAPTNSRRTSNFHAPTPTSVPGAKTIKTRELVDLLTNSKPVLINVLDWQEGSFAIPGTIWIQGLGKDRLYRLDLEQIEALFTKIAPEKNAPLVFYCLSWECWASYNASLRALDLGYTNVLWYRGGIESWMQANLPTVRTRLYKQF
jgi:PQQ-dependent catabolism-associated CXXCW motif protein